MRGFCLDLKVLSIGLLCVTVGWGLHDAVGNEPRTGSIDVEAKSNEPLNPGPPLNETDFFLATQLARRNQNSSTDSMMRAPEHLSMEELEAIGEKYVKKLNSEQRNILASVSYHWPNGVLYYTIDAAFDSTERATIAAGMKMVEDNSCIRFVARTTENDYVDIIPGGGGCYAQVPYRTGRGRMEIGLQRNGCVYEKVVVHELLHSLGFMHEMNRPDRDTYITINWSNIVNSGSAQFYKDAW